MTLRLFGLILLQHSVLLICPPDTGMLNVITVNDLEWMVQFLVEFPLHRDIFDSQRKVYI